MLWVLIALPFGLSAATGGPDGHLGGPGATVGRLLPHAVFHPVYVLLLIGAILVLLRLRSATSSGVVRGVAVALVVAQVVAIAGMVGEEIAVLRHGGLSAGKELFDLPQHYLFADALTFPGLFAGPVLLVAITIAAVLATRAEQRRGTPRRAA